MASEPRGGGRYLICWPRFGKLVLTVSYSLGGTIDDDSLHQPHRRQHLTAGKGATRTAHLTGFLRSFSLGFTVAAAAAVVVAITDAVGAAAAYLARGCFVCTIEMPRLDGRNVIGLGPAKAGLHSRAYHQ
ncbi:hypothetical protein TsFJ059_001649 [Trichoderma semiorbis]|uniref:Uncharacterized protein n=1 Tax=Trichoderma semiorbis TaxID=1491008 RepID=A0A9P8HXV0_9HYPO|nr:hypothetical protein TsFJ059_001649 [Trichoderma semiorbis]